jgi:hypothetical protein
MYYLFILFINILRFLIIMTRFIYTIKFPNFKVARIPHASVRKTHCYTYIYEPINLKFLLHIKDMLLSKHVLN